MDPEESTRAVRARTEAPESAEDLLAAAVARAAELGALGWVRADGGEVSAHVEGAPAAVTGLVAFLEDAAGAPVEVDEIKREGHEQFAIRGVSAGAFVVREHRARAHHYDLRLEVGDTMRSWTVPKGPSLDPAVKRMALAAPDHDPGTSYDEGPIGDGHAIVWDRGDYERGGRVSWPEALERGHAVFVLHGEKLGGGFALQRTGGRSSPRWLLVKRVDDDARPGSDITAEQPRSVISGRTLDDLGA